MDQRGWNSVLRSLSVSVGLLLYNLVAAGSDTTDLHRVQGFIFPTLFNSFLFSWFWRIVSEGLLGLDSPCEQLQL